MSATTVNLATIERDIQRARILLITEQPFFGSLSMRLKIEADTSIKTFATDGKRIIYNPEFAASLTQGELKGVMAHEVAHCALAHHCRRDGREPRRYNAACDFAINPLLKQAGLELPKGALDDPQYHGLSAEEIYAKLPEMPPGSGCGFGEVQDGTDEAGKPASAAELEQQAQDWQIAAQAQEAACKKQGTMPGGMDRALDEAKAAKVDWKSVLRRFLVHNLPAEQSWSRANRRFVSQGLYLPGVKKENMGGLSVWIDTSGSIGGREMDEFGSEVFQLVRECRPEWLDVGFADARVQRVTRFELGETPVLEPKGGGGTDFRPAFEHVAGSEQQPACMIYLTDMYGSFPVEHPEFPVLWVSNSSIEEAPFGEVVRMRP